MSVQLFFQTHGRFPTAHEFATLKSIMPYQPKILSPTIPPTDPLHTQFAHAARHGDLKKVQELLPQIGLNNLDSSIPTRAHGPYDPNQPSSLFNTPDDPHSPTNLALHMQNGGSKRVQAVASALCAAAQGDHLSILSYLINNNASVDYRPAPMNRPALLFAAESGHFNSLNYLIGRGSTYFTYNDQCLESYYISYIIRQSITRRELSYALPGDYLPGIVLDYIGLGGNRPLHIERLAPPNMYNKTAYGAVPIPAYVLPPIYCPNNSFSNEAIRTFTPEEYDEWVQEQDVLKQIVKDNDLNEKNEKRAVAQAFVTSVYPQGIEQQTINSNATTTTSPTTVNQQTNDNKIEVINTQPSQEVTTNTTNNPTGEPIDNDENKKVDVNDDNNNNNTNNESTLPVENATPNNNDTTTQQISNQQHEETNQQQPE